MKFKIEVTRSFEKGLKRLTLTEQKVVAEKLKLLQTNRFHPSLRTKRVKGFNNLFECSVNMSIRILWRYKEDKILILLDIGHHSMVDKL